MAAKKSGGRVYIATTSGTADVDGENYPFTKNVTRVSEGHPLLKQCPDFFELAENHIHYEVEQATAAPGEKRGG